MKGNAEEQDDREDPDQENEETGIPVPERPVDDRPEYQGIDEAKDNLREQAETDFKLEPEVGTNELPEEPGEETATVGIDVPHGDGVPASRSRRRRPRLTRSPTTIRASPVIPS